MCDGVGEVRWYFIRPGAVVKIIGDDLIDVLSGKVGTFI